MNKIPTAEELFKELFEKSDCYIDYNKSGLDVIKKSMIEFAKLHVKQALQAAAENAVTEDADYIADGHYEKIVNKESILNAYPESNIK